VVAVCWSFRGDSDAQSTAHRQDCRATFCYAASSNSLPLITIARRTAFGRMLAYLRGAIVISDWITSLAGTIRT